MSSHTRDIKDKTGLLDDLITTIVEKGRAHFMHLGTFTLVQRKGGKRYDVTKRTMVPYGAYMTIAFNPSKPLREMLNTGKARKRRSPSPTKS